jgi:hypothetical protein
MLSSIIEDFNYGVNREEKLKGFDEYFKISSDTIGFYKLAGMEIPKIDMPDYAWRAFNLFYNYNKIEVQHQATKCLMYDLIPFADMTFVELYSDIMYGKKYQNVVDNQEKKALCDNETGIILVNKVKHIADKLFDADNFFQKAAFISAVLTVVDARWLNDDQFDLEFDIELVKLRLLKMIDEREWNWTMSKYDDGFCDRTLWYLQSTAPEPSIDETIEVVERLLVEEGNIEDLIKN